MFTDGMNEAKLVFITYSVVLFIFCLFFFFFRRAVHYKNRRDIREKIDKLIPVIGLQSNKPINYSKEIYDRTRDIRECINFIAKGMGLPIEIKLTYLPPKVNDNIAHVEIPEVMPIWGSPELIGYPVRMTIKLNIESIKYQTFVLVVVHELSHVVLKLFKQELTFDEISVDLVPLLLGYAPIVEIGRTEYNNLFAVGAVERKIYGYLDDDQFNTAINYINRKNGRFSIWNSIAKTLEAIFSLSPLYKIIASLLISLGIGLTMSSFVETNEQSTRQPTTINQKHIPTRPTIRLPENSKWRIAPPKSEFESDQLLQEQIPPEGGRYSNATGRRGEAPLKIRTSGIILYNVPDGNMRTQNINKEDF